MAGEGSTQDFKLAYDPEDGSQKLALVKDLIAMANSGGGSLVIGRSETESPGISPEVADDLDSAKIADYSGRFIAPSRLDLSHEIERLANGNVILTLTVAAAEYPVVMSRQGTWSGFDSAEDRPLFRKGEVWARHSSKTERVSHDDLRRWIEAGKQQERDKIMERLTTYVNLPEGTTLQAVAPSGLAIDSPMRLIESARYRRERDPDHLLSADDLLWIFRQRDALDLTEEDLEILVASALRRSATLYWWLTQTDDPETLVLNELNAVFDASDRDKSDAASSIVELAALYASDGELQSLVAKLDDSRYKHFREAVDDWGGRGEVLTDLTERIGAATHEGDPLLDYSIREIEQIASLVAEELSESQSSALSRKLSTITRAIWAKVTERGRQLMENAGP